MPTPHPLNIIGDFYVMEGCCTMCGVPFVEAPELFGSGPDSKGFDECYVKRQPESPKELNAMLRTMDGAEFNCVRYRGTDPQVAERVARVNRALVDQPTRLPYE